MRQSLRYREGEVEGIKIKGGGGWKVDRWKEIWCVSVQCVSDGPNDLIYLHMTVSVSLIWNSYKAYFDIPVS